jgi:hypothetical protein
MHAPITQDLSNKWCCKWLPHVTSNHATLHQLSLLKGLYISSFEFSEK